VADVHVVPRAEGWAVEVDGQERGTFSTRAEAIREGGRRLAEQEQGELVIHGECGQIRENDSHGNDPREIPG
jgi:Arc/MetJ-type ribon-helix-helix transcriptional regulator